MELKEQIRRIIKVLDSGCECPESWQGLHCETDDCDECFVRHTLAAVEESGYVRVADDQTPPENPYPLADYENRKLGERMKCTHLGYSESQKEMLTPVPISTDEETAWVKVRRKRTPEGGK